MECTVDNTARVNVLGYSFLLVEAVQQQSLHGAGVRRHCSLLYITDAFAACCE